MPSDELVTGPRLEAWQRLLVTNGLLLHSLDADLRELHGMTLNDYDVLVQLRDAPSGSLQMGELCRHTLLTRSGMTRLINGLVSDGMVERRQCEYDGRVFRAMITDWGHMCLAEARIDHHAGIRRLFADHLTVEEASELARLLDKIPGVRDALWQSAERA